MKRHFLTCTLACVLLTFIPLIPALLLSPESTSAGDTQLSETGEDAETAALTESTETAIQEETEALPDTTGTYKVLDTATGEVTEVTVRDYIIGAVGAEMPASFETEALKAQAVAVHTYAERLVCLAQSREQPELQGADFSNDSSRYQAFWTDAQLREAYGSDYDAYYAKISAAADAVLGEILTYENQPILAAFHAMSSGRTESAANVWGSEVAYLQSVDSSADTDAPFYEQTVTYSEEEVRSLLTSARSGMILGADASAWFGTPEVSDAGTVIQISVGNSIFTGQELRTCFSLRSAAVTVAYDSGTFSFTTKGYGHDVGMSQYGANAMAKDGADYREILAYYYPGAVLTQN
jgi:stage II sporulation protein D